MRAETTGIDWHIYVRNRRYYATYDTCEYGPFSSRDACHAAGQAQVALVIKLRMGCEWLHITWESERVRRRIDVVQAA
jgi:hypothetical protein